MSILARCKEGTEPREFTIVATAPRRPSRCNLAISSYIFIPLDDWTGAKRSQAEARRSRQGIRVSSRLRGRLSMACALLLNGRISFNF